MSKTPQQLFRKPNFEVTLFDDHWIPLPRACFVAANGKDIGDYLDLWREFAGGHLPLGEWEAEMLRQCSLIQVEVTYEQ